MSDLLLKLTSALETYRRRSTYASHPNGTFDNARRWHPTDSEHRGCCDHIRYPSRAYPMSLNKHCRTATHVAALFDIDEKMLRKAIRLVNQGMTIEASVSTVMN